MADISRRALLIAVVLGLYTVLVVLSIYAPLRGPETEVQSSLAAGLLMPLLGVTTLFCVVLYVILRLDRRVDESSSRIAQLEQRLAGTEEDISSAEQEHRQHMEKKLFEIGVINASLHREIAERMQAENESRQLQKRMELILNSAGDGIFGLDTNGIVTFANTAASVMTGWRIDELVGQPHHELVHHSYSDGSPHPPQACQIRQAYVDGIVHFNSDDVFWTREGSSFPVEYVSTPIKDNNDNRNSETIHGAVVVFRDRSIYV
jgi:PAS domain S-box-containing protein